MSLFIKKKQLSLLIESIKKTIYFIFLTREKNYVVPALVRHLFHCRGNVDKKLFGCITFICSCTRNYFYPLGSSGEMEKMPVGVQNCASWKKKKNDKTTTIADNQSENPRKKKLFFKKMPSHVDRIFLLPKMLFQ